MIQQSFAYDVYLQSGMVTYAMVEARHVVLGSRQVSYDKKNEDDVTHNF